MPETIYGCMITGKQIARRAMALVAIDNFHAQNWAKKTLNIVNSGIQLRPKYDLRVREIATPNRNLGSLRNMALDLVPDKAIWIQWDDDDFRRRDLLDEQYKQLAHMSAACVLLRNQIRYDFELNAAWVARTVGGFAGTIMARNSGVRYPRIKIGEDDLYYRRYAEFGAASIWDNDPSLYIRFNHGRNSCARDHMLGDYVPKRDRWDLDESNERYLAAVLRNYPRPTP